MALVQIASAEAQCSGSNFPQVALRQEVWRDNTGSGVDPVGNDEQLYVKLMLVKRGSSSSGTSTYKADGCTARAVIDGATVFEATNVGYDFRQSSGRNATGTVQMLWEGWVTVPHASDGTKTLGFSGVWDTPSGTILGDTSVSGSTVLPKITVAPVVPSSVAAVRVSDSQVALSWVQTNPGHGVPTQNEYRVRVNGGAWSEPTVVSVTTSVTVAVGANQKREFQVRAKNAAGTSAWSSTTAPVYTSPAAPSGVGAAKDANQDIVVSWTGNVGFSEHQHVVQHSSDGGSSWSALATVNAGTGSYKHTSPNPAVTHRYRVRAVNTSGGLTSAWVESATVQLLAPPAKPSIAALGAYIAADRDVDVLWVHNSVDTTPQSAYQVGLSTDAGVTWVTGSKVTSTVSKYTIPADTYAPDDSLMLRVRTWGQASSGGSDGAGGSPWSDPQSVVFKSAPVVSSVDPGDGATYGEAALRVSVGFSQAEGASFVQVRAVLSDGTGPLETVTAGSLVDVPFDTVVSDGGSYELTVEVLDSHGIWSAPVVVEFDVAYTLPVAPVVSVSYLRESGRAQVDVTVPAAGAGEADVVSVSVARAIGGVSEQIIVGLPVSVGEVSVIDTTPALRGPNVYTVSAFSADGAVVQVSAVLTIDEDWWAFFTDESGNSVGFFGNLRFSVAANRESALVVAAGRRRPIALFGEQRSVVVSGSATLFAGEGSSPAEVEAFLLDAGVVCYRDPSGRRMFGQVSGSLSSAWAPVSEFSYQVVEAT